MTLTAQRLMLSEILIFDWNGPQFLMFYLIALGVCVGWSFWRSSKSMARFQVPASGSPMLTNPYEIAYLSGGALRAVQLVVVRLVSGKLLEWRKTGNLHGLVRTSQPLTADLNDIERTVAQSAGSFGTSGMQLRNVADAISGPLSQIERRLAILGLKPTASEQVGVGLRAAMPLVFLMGIGIIKVFIGIEREKPVLFLLMLLLVSLIITIVVIRRTPRLTIPGRNMLEGLRARHADSEQQALRGQPLPQQDASIVFSLLGPACLIGMGAQLGIDPLLGAHLRTAGANQGGGGGCSASSGCSSDGGGDSGCGGGGCGGCGGGGD